MSDEDHDTMNRLIDLRKQYQAAIDEHRRKISALENQLVGVELAEKAMESGCERR